MALGRTQILSIRRRDFCGGKRGSEGRFSTWRGILLLLLGFLWRATLDRRNHVSQVRGAGVFLLYLVLASTVRNVLLHQPAQLKLKEKKKVEDQKIFFLLPRLPYAPIFLLKRVRDKVEESLKQTVPPLPFPFMLFLVSHDFSSILVSVVFFFLFG